MYSCGALCLYVMQKQITKKCNRINIIISKMTLNCSRNLYQQCFAQALRLKDNEHIERHRQKTWVSNCEINQSIQALFTEDDLNSLAKKFCTIFPARKGKPLSPGLWLSELASQNSGCLSGGFTISNTFFYFFIWQSKSLSFTMLQGHGASGCKSITSEHRMWCWLIKCFLRFRSLVYSHIGERRLAL